MEPAPKPFDLFQFFIDGQNGELDLWVVLVALTAAMVFAVCITAWADSIVLAADRWRKDKTRGPR